MRLSGSQSLLSGRRTRHEFIPVRSASQNCQVPRLVVRRGHQSEATNESTMFPTRRPGYSRLLANEQVRKEVPSRISHDRRQVCTHSRPPEFFGSARIFGPTTSTTANPCDALMSDRQKSLPSQNTGLDLPWTAVRCSEQEAETWCCELRPVAERRLAS